MKQQYAILFHIWNGKRYKNARFLGSFNQNCIEKLIEGFNWRQKKILYQIGDLSRPRDMERICFRFVVSNFIVP